MGGVASRLGVGIRACLAASLAISAGGGALHAVVSAQSPLPSANAAPSAVPASPHPSASASVTILDPAVDLLAPGRLVICSSFPRLRFAEWAADGRPVGVDIEIGTAIAAALGLKPDVQERAFESLIDAVAGRECDVSIAGQFVTAARLERIDMIPYRQGTPHVIVHAGDPDTIDELLDLCGRTLAVVSGTVHVDMVRGGGEYVGRGLDEQCAAAGRAPIDLREHPDQASAEAALASGDEQAYIGNDFIAQDRPDEFALSVALLPTRNGIGHRLAAPELDRAIRAALGTMIDDGTYLAILDRYGVSHVAIRERP